MLRCTLKWISDGKKEHLEENRVFGMASGGEFHVEKHEFNPGYALSNAVQLAKSSRQLYMCLERGDRNRWSLSTDVI